nr:CSC1-like protein At1g32090 [Tanacetum cinerariifolium]
MMVLARNVPQGSSHSVSDNVDQFFKKNHPGHYLCHQVVYNANKFGRLVGRRHRLQNWLDYNQLKYERNPGKRPTLKTGFLGLWGKKVDSIEYYKQHIKEFDLRMSCF